MPESLQAYLNLVRRRRVFSAVLLVIFVSLIATDFRLAEGHNADGFVNGLPMLTAFPAKVISEAW